MRSPLTHLHYSILVFPYAGNMSVSYLKKLKNPLPVENGRNCGCIIPLSVNNDQMIKKRNTKKYEEATDSYLKLELVVHGQ